MTPEYREALEGTFREFQEKTSTTGMSKPQRAEMRAERRRFNQRAREALARARDPEADLASRSQAPEPEPGPQERRSCLPILSEILRAFVNTM